MRALSLSVVIGLAAIGCGGDSSGESAFLTIVGDDELEVAADSTVPLTVRYHDAQDLPLTGKVSFRVEGDVADVALSRAQDATDDYGRVTVSLLLGRGQAGAFDVIAEAEGAEPAVWHISQGTPKLRLDGSYELESRFEIEGLPEAQFGGTVTLLELSDDPNDPATWILDQVEAELDEPFQSLLEIARNGLALDAKLNDKIAELSPGFIEGLQALGSDLDDAVGNLGLLSVLDTQATDAVEGEAGSIHDVEGGIFWIAGERYEFTRQQMGLGVMSTEGVVTAIENSRTFTVKEHTLRLPYGRMMNFVVDRVIVPLHDPSADNLPELIAGMLDCESLGDAMAEEIDFGSGSIYEAACRIGVTSALDGLAEPFGDAMADLRVSGTARPIDGDDNHDIDELRDGLWVGRLIFDQGEVVLARPDQTFSGKQIAPSTR